MTAREIALQNTQASQIVEMPRSDEMTLSYRSPEIVSVGSAVELLQGAGSYYADYSGMLRFKY